MPVPAESYRPSSWISGGHFVAREARGGMEERGEMEEREGMEEREEWRGEGASLRLALALLNILTVNRPVASVTCVHRPIGNWST